MLCGLFYFINKFLSDFRESLAFATEPVFASLANLMGGSENMPSPPPKYLNNFKLFDLEIKYGLLQVCLDSILFLNYVSHLHTDF